MTVRVRKVAEAEIQAQRGRVKEQASLRAADTDAAVVEAVNSPEATQDEDWQEFEQPDHLKRVGEQPFKLLKPWHEMLKHGVMSKDGEPRTLHEIELQPNKFVPAEELKKLNHQYFPDEDKIQDTITEDTLFWYPKGKFNLQAGYEPDREYYGPDPMSPDREIAGVLLKGVLSQEAQQEALEGLEQMEPWPLPTRAETRTAIARQQGANTPGEYTMGYTGHMTVERTKAVRDHKDPFARLGPLIYEMNDCFARVLPFYYRQQNVPKSLTERFAERMKWQEEKAKKKVESLKHYTYDYGGILNDLRQLATSAFSTLALLKSCPSSIHQDAGNARPEQTSFTCLTSIRPPEGFTGGTFCFIEYGYKVPVQPGDLLIAQTTREWHCNVGQVKGVKYSLVCYYRRGMANPALERKKSTYDTPEDFDRASREADQRLP